MKNVLIAAAIAGVISIVVGLSLPHAPPVKVGTQAIFNTPYTCVGGLCTWNVTGSCQTGTSTIISIQNPWNATSTLTYFSILGTQGATTTDITVGTSTTNSIASGNTNAGTTTLAESIMGLATVGTSTQFFSVAGMRLGSNKGYTDPQGTPAGGAINYVTNSRIGVGPSEYILGFATSTYFDAQTGATGAAQVATPSSCTFMARFEKATP